MRKEIIIEYVKRSSRPVSAYEIAHMLQEKHYTERLDSLRRLCNTVLNKAVDDGTLHRSKYLNPLSKRERNVYCSMEVAKRLGITTNSGIKRQSPIDGDTSTTLHVNEMANEYISEIGCYFALTTKMKYLIRELKCRIDTSTNPHAVELRHSKKYNKNTRSPLCRYSLIQVIGKLDDVRKGLNVDEIYPR